MVYNQSRGCIVFYRYLIRRNLFKEKSRGKANAAASQRELRKKVIPMATKKAAAKKATAKAATKAVKEVKEEVKAPAAEVKAAEVKAPAKAAAPKAAEVKAEVKAEAKTEAKAAAPTLWAATKTICRTTSGGRSRSGRAESRHKRWTSSSRSR